MIQLGNLESNLARGCTLACTSCNHGSAVAEHWFMEPESMERDLARLGQVAHFWFHCLQGGEPTLNKKLIDFMGVQQRSGIAEHYGMLTNGTLLDRQPDEFWRLAKEMNYEIRLSHYPALNPRTLMVAKEQAEKYKVDLRVSNEFEHFLKMFVTHTDHGQRVWSKCPWKRCWTVHEGYLFHCPVAAFFPGQFPEEFHNRGLGRPDPLIDGYPLASLSEKMVEAMLERETPLATCAICTGGMHGDLPWSQTRDRAAWVKESTA